MSSLPAHISPTAMLSSDAAHALSSNHAPVLPRLRARADEMDQHLATDSVADL